jgi:hypothetical protein
MLFKSSAHNIKKFFFNGYFLTKKNRSIQCFSFSSSSSNADEQQVKFPLSTKVVICGGGLFGTSVAYHLAQLGYKDVVLVTRDKCVFFFFILTF